MCVLMTRVGPVLTIVLLLFALLHGASVNGRPEMIASDDVDWTSSSRSTEDDDDFFNHIDTDDRDVLVLPSSSSAAAAPSQHLPHRTSSDNVGPEMESAPIEVEQTRLNETVRRLHHPSSGGDERKRRRLPQAIIIGVKKGGTRALLEFLKEHPDVRAPSPEIHFFDRHYDKGLEWYRQQMPATTRDQLTIEKTPSYFVTKAVPHRVHNMSSTVRLIVVVRDPVTRAVSDYTQAIAKQRDASQRRPFHELAFLDRNASTDGPVSTGWGAVRIGVYARHLERWLRYFPPTQIHFVHGEHLISDPAAELAAVQDFLGLRRLVTEDMFFFSSTKGFPCLRRRRRSVDTRPSLPADGPPVAGDSGPTVETALPPMETPRCLGKTKGRTHPPIEEKVLQRLRDFYRPFNSKFYRLTGRDFGWN